jgi:hypothetical protein
MPLGRFTGGLMTSRFLKIILVVAFNAWWCCALSLLLPTLVLAQSAPPLPDDIRIESPATDLPPEIKEFSGAWEGEWREAIPRASASVYSKQKVRLKVILVVEKVWDQGAIVVFAWGDCPGLRYSKKWGRYQARISSDDGSTELPFIHTYSYKGGPTGLTFTAADGRDYTFFINKQGHLEAIVKWGWGRLLDTELARMEAIPAGWKELASKPPKSKAATEREEEAHKQQALTKTNRLEHYYVKKPKNVRTDKSNSSFAQSAYQRQENQEDRSYFQGVDYIFSGNYGKAISEFNKVLSINSEYGEAYFSRGVAFIFQGQYSRAIADFNQYLQFERNSVRGLYNRGLVHALQG